MIAEAKAKGVDWSRQERLNWTPPGVQRPSLWAEEHRVLPAGQTARPGRWKNANAPYLRGVMDLGFIPGVVELNVMKAAQAGVSEACRNIIGCVADQDPDPVGLALPDRIKGRKIVRNRIHPLFLGTDVLRARLSERKWDLSSESIQLTNGFLLHLMWSGSASSMASDPMRFAIVDEVDKFESWTGKEAGPVELIAKRLRTYQDRKLQINISTPTTRFGKIHQLWEGSTIRLWFFCPCPHCGKHQRLKWANVKWPKMPGTPLKELAGIIREKDCAWYECEHCAGQIAPGQKDEMIRQGVWRDDEGKIQDAEKVQSFPRGTVLGLHISALYCMWVSWGEVAAEFLHAIGDYSKMWDFWTQTLGLPFETKTAGSSSEVFWKKSEDSTHTEGIAEAWVQRIVVAIDTQHDHFWFVVRGWGPGMRSHRIAHGQARNFDELDGLFLKRLWPIAGRGKFPVDLVLIDSGGTQLDDDSRSMTSKVYQWVMTRSPRGALVRAIKGDARPRPGLWVRRGKGFVDDGGANQRKSNSKFRRPQLALWLIDTGHYNDELDSWLAQDEETKGSEGFVEKWALNRRNDGEYNQHLANLHKVVIRRGSLIEERWVPVSDGARHDYRDCEVYQLAGANMLQVHLLPTHELSAAPPTPRREEAADASWSIPSLKSYL